ncbi:interferon lambda receptor 1-like [Scomber scombrus]|uniref:Interferon lambda receptor 1-like n=1 Tax=Scomber scombrus TaxID=13677 RepID=A0AAV1P9J3_SCOSC|nr:interferon lambda receptor 1-like [Scomber scombrus]XP_062287844.1 interferon lambda receptor 1-like [Scomber scombrus]XP_062287845.1 interferon lambda receptor 1-like [Scomber scombrus]
MTALIWLLTWLPQVLSAMSELLPPVNVTLTSKELIHLLRWLPAPGTPAGVYYHVASCLNTGTQLLPVTGCERVQHPLVCNLTDAFSNPTLIYLTRITTRLDTQPASKPFDYKKFEPIEDTELYPPRLNVTPCGKGLCVELQPHTEHLRYIYKSRSYRLRIRSNNTDKGQFFRDTKGLEGLNLTDLAPGRQYCVSVCFPKKCNYSRPQCAFTHGVFNTDVLISALSSTVTCLLVMSVVVVLVLRFQAGFMCLKWRPMPQVLTSIQHIQEDLAQPSHLSSLLYVTLTLPSAGTKRNSQTSSDDSDGESETESTAASTGAGYKLRAGNKPLSAFTTSSSSSSAPLSPDPVVPHSYSSKPDAVFLPPGFFSPQPEASTSGSRLNQTGTANTTSPPAPVLNPAGPDSPTEEGRPVGDGDCQVVNLFSLTFGRREEKEEEKSHPDISEVEPESPSTILILPSHTLDTKEVTIETVSCLVVEEEEDEDELSPYMRRPDKVVLRNLI